MYCGRSDSVRPRLKPGLFEACCCDGLSGMHAPLDAADAGFVLAAHEHELALAAVPRF
jgi:hypothetical protein